MSEPPATPTVVIFGASGDLTRRKLVPAVYSLHRKGRIPAGTRVIGFARSDFGHEEFRRRLREGAREFASHFEDAAWDAFSKNIYYLSGSPSQLENFRRLDSLASELESGQPCGRLYYLSTPPELYESIVVSLGAAGMHSEAQGWRRIIIEKPFGRDLPSARELNRRIHAVWDEHQVYRIDHYLGKETVQNLSIFRFANAIYEPLWNRNYIDHVQISVLESVAVGRRAGYYDTAGVLRDMFQNHLLQLLTLIAIEPPVALNADALRNEKVKVLSAIRPIGRGALPSQAVRAQYRTYRQEPNVAPGSTTPTYAALKLHVDNWRWHGVPFYLRSGKALSSRKTQIVVQFKRPPHLLFALKSGESLAPNILAMEIQPNEGIHLSFQAKIPDAGMAMQTVNFDFHYAEAFGDDPIPEAYERLILDALQGDASLFTRSDEIELAWGLIDPIIDGLNGADAAPLESYEHGSWGPAGADALLARDERAWVN